MRHGRVELELGFVLISRQKTLNAASIYFQVSEEHRFCSRLFVHAAAILCALPGKPNSNALQTVREVLCAMPSHVCVCPKLDSFDPELKIRSVTPNLKLDMLRPRYTGPKTTNPTRFSLLYVPSHKL